MSEVHTRDGGKAIITRWDARTERPIVGVLIGRSSGDEHNVEQVMTWLPCGSFRGDVECGCDLMLGPAGGKAA